MSDLVVLDGSTFFVSTKNGDVEQDSNHGFFQRDMRHISLWRLKINHAPMHLLTSREEKYYQARIFGTLSTVRVGENPTISIERSRIVADGVHEDLIVQNQCATAASVQIALEFDTDFADIFEIKDQMSKRGNTSVEVKDNQVTFMHQRENFKRGTHITFSEPGELSQNQIKFNVDLEPRGQWELHIDVSCINDNDELPPRHACDASGNLRPHMSVSLDQWLDEAPKLETNNDTLHHTYVRSLVDLAALRFRPLPDLEWSLPAAGLPWFMALFGRDSLLTAYEALPFQPHLAATTLQALADYQATNYDDFRDAEPGKILHELRRGELVELQEWPHSPYYGTHDATPLFLVLLDEYEKWTGDVDLVRRLEPAARMALAWIEGPGDQDHDGYLEYKTRSSKGLINQCWKDSWNSICFADGSIAQPPMATCEIQGYAYDARCRMARLAREIWADDKLAERLESDAAALKGRFNKDFWNVERGHYVIALDGGKKQVDSVTSNIGHLLWSGIVNEERAAETVERLMAEDMFSGWGIRTMSSNEIAYNPIEYHNGTVWPHDTAFIAEGLRRYDFPKEASQLATAIIEAAGAFDYRLPEVFAGFSRQATVMPVEYPTASRPQAWSAGAPLLALRTMLGLDVKEGNLKSSPCLSANGSLVSLSKVPVRGRRWVISKLGVEAER